MDITRSLMSAAGGSSGPGLNWTAQNTQNSISRSIACSPSGLFVAVGDCISTSNDGITWNRQSIPYGDQYYKVIWDGSKFIACGKTGIATPVPFIKTSTDGVTWSTATIPATSGTAVACVGGYGSNLIATFLFSTTVLVSSNGTTWTASGGALPASARWQACTYNPILGLYAVGRFNGASNTVYTSPDAVTWTARACGSGTNDTTSLGFVFDINYMESTGYFLLSGMGSSGNYDKLFSSPDGITWTRIYRASSPSSGGCGVIKRTTESPFDGYVTLFGSASARSIFTFDGVNTTVNTTTFGGSINAFAWSATSGRYAYSSSSVFFLNSNLIMGGGGGANAFITSGLALSLVTSTAKSNTAIIAGGEMPSYCTAISYTFDTKAAVYRSTDGLNWTPVFYLGDSVVNTTTNVAYGAGVFVAVTKQGGVWSSSDDGVTWVARSGIGTDFGVTALVCWGGSMFVVIGYQYGAGRNLYSYDGITWQTNFDYYVNISTGALTAITWDGTYFNAYNSTILARSSDGIIWVNLTPTGLPTSVKSVTYKDGLYVLGGNEVGGVGSRKNIFTSTNGINWTFTITPVFYYVVDGVVVTSVYTDGFNFYAAASLGDVWWVMSSGNGVDWTERTSYLTFQDTSLSAYTTLTINTIGQFGSSLYGFGRPVLSIKS
jgi:hypothetical protein